MLFMSRTPAQMSRTSQGGPLLLLRTVHRVGLHQAEAWTLFWSGQAAQDFYEAHGRQLLAGQPLQVVTEKLRAHVVGTRVEIQARVLSCVVLPRAGATGDEGERAERATVGATV